MANSNAHSRSFSFDDEQGEHLRQMARREALPGIWSSNFRTVSVTRTQHRELLDRVVDHLIEDGFDRDWNTTNSGELLESIIDELTAGGDQ